MILQRHIYPLESGARVNMSPEIFYYEIGHIGNVRGLDWPPPFYMRSELRS